jgi:predicted esterase
MINRLLLIKPLLLLLLMLPAWLHANTEELIRLDDGSTVKVFTFYPKDHGQGPWPLCILMPGGAANEYVARAQFWLGRELANRGWAIAVPVSPDGTPFFGANAEKIPEIISHLKRSENILPGKSLLVGVSNGGSAAIEIASRSPQNYLGVVAVPGIIKNDSAIGNMQGLPVYVRIGANDSLRWNRQLPALIEKLNAADAKVNAALVPGAKHVFQINWDDLQPWLDSLQNN